MNVQIPEDEVVIVTISAFCPVQRMWNVLCGLKHSAGAVFTPCDIRKGTARHSHPTKLCLQLQGKSFSGRDCEVLTERRSLCSLLEIPSSFPSPGLSQPAPGPSWSQGRQLWPFLFPRNQGSPKTTGAERECGQQRDVEGNCQLWEVKMFLFREGVVVFFPFSLGYMEGAE